MNFITIDGWKLEMRVVGEQGFRWGVGEIDQLLLPRAGEFVRFAERVLN